jgi:hypothetical protein
LILGFKYVIPKVEKIVHLIKNKYREVLDGKKFYHFSSAWLGRIEKCSRYKGSRNVLDKGDK